ncbi:MAG: 1,6-anhydro-N-acetylmuramyl-L-alanine amidase AmpD [Pseudomonadota bacterium]
MRIDTTTGLVDGAVYLPSPNCDDRPQGVAVDLIVVHGISLPPGEFGGDYISRFFLNELDPSEHPFFETIADLRVSAHVLVRRDGSVVQYVPFHKRAWHAGQSTFEGRTACNDFAVGIELEGTDETPYAAEQYAALVALVQALCGAYPALDTQRIAGHADIAPGRKTDPGPAFDWPRLHRLLAAAPRSRLA